MSNKTCPACGAPLALDAVECRFCGEKLTNNVQQPQAPVYQQPPVYQAPPYQQQPPQSYTQVIEKPYKSKTTAGLLALLLGGLGVHKFYLGRIGKGILYLVFCWTYIPAIIAFIEAIIYFSSSQENFMRKYVK